MLNTTTMVDGLTEEEISEFVDKRIADLLGVSPEDLKEFEGGAAVMSTPSVLSAVRATAYAHC